MTGAEHYREAERLIDLANGIATSHPVEHQTIALAAAQVHATLALAASQLRSLTAEADKTKVVEP